MDEMNQMEIADEKHKTLTHLHGIQAQKSYFLGEYRERIIAALNIDQLIEDELYPEIITAMHNKNTKIVKMRRDVGLEFLKPYIREAEKLNVRYELVDGLSYKGDIGLVVVSGVSLDNESEDLIIRDMDQDFIDAGLGMKFSKSRGKAICKNCLREIEEKLPEYTKEFKKIGILSKLFGTKCPICEKK